VNFVKNLSSPTTDYDALVIVSSELDQIQDHVDRSVVKDLQAFKQVRTFREKLTTKINILCRFS